MDNPDMRPGPVKRPSGRLPLDASPLHGAGRFLAALAALVAPWLLGGRAEVAPWILGSLLWGSALLVLAGVVSDHLTRRTSAAWERRRGQATRSPLGTFSQGLLRTVPLWLFLLILCASLLNPAYRWEGGALVRQDYLAWLPLVIDPHRSVPGIFLLSGLLAALGLLANPACVLSRRGRTILLAALLANAMVLCWTGLWFHFVGNGLILGRFEPVASYFFATFYYKNHWAAFAILYSGVGASFFFRDLPRWFTHGRRAGSGGLALLALFFLGLTYALAGSRSGILLFGIFSVGVFAGLYKVLNTRFRQWKPAILAALMLVPAGFLFLASADLRDNWERTGQQIEQGGSVVFDSVRAWHAPEVCLAMLADRPVWGWGYLSYDPLFPVYATDYFRDEAGQLTVDMEFAHNDWLQSFAEFGVLGTVLGALGLAGMAAVAHRGGHGFRERRWIYLGLLLLTLLALWDFPFSNPAVLVNAGVLALLATKGTRTNGG